MIINPARFQDRDAIMDLLKQTTVFHEKEIVVALQVLEDALRQTDTMDYYAFCGFGEGGELLGYICFGPITVTDDCYDLYWIAVRKSSLRRGIGEELLSFMEKYLIDRGARRVYLDTSSTAVYEPARRFYEKHGYAFVCMLDDFYREGDHRMVYMKGLRKSVFNPAEVACVGQDPQRN
jgi:ribosomal protein S18 acetylase RimI-like enzyme